MELSKPEKEESAIDLGIRTANVTSFVLLSKIVAFVFVGAAFIIITRILGPAGYGIYVLATGVAGVFSSIGNFGVATALNRFIAKYSGNKRKQAKVLSEGFFLIAMVGILATLIALVFSGTIAGFYHNGSNYVYIFRLISFSIVLSMLFGAAYSSLVGLGKSDMPRLSITAESILQSVVGVTLAVLGFGPVAPVMGIIVGYLAGFVVGIILIFRQGIKFTMPKLVGLKKLFKFSLPIAGSNILGAAVNNVALLLLGLFATTFVVGNFGIASRANFLFDIVLGSIGISLLPTFTASMRNSRIKSRTGEFYSYSVYLAFLLVAPMIFFVAVFAKQFSYTAFSSEYSLAPLYIAVTSIGLLIGIAGSYASTLLISAGKVRKVLSYNAIIAVIEFALMLLLVPIFKGIGLVVLLFIVNPLLIDFLFIRKSIQVFKAKINWRRISRVVAANIIVSAVVYSLLYFVGISYVLMLLLGFAGFIILYPIILGIIGGISTDDINLITRV
ncbi:MAG: oligosaccharide flippase family protein, partial [Candidatus Marsarchaeota archaeon]|nr:oligosaccharide flippase family protein [Candidatus Marsarchaeota archaeon]